ncbi:MAG: hypothetical protein CSYNP_02580 [Syntrophus sp. SKADARSKE-3]|nr:hypothetical protein [Syntrophus sp. SKADARSKE-3]
MKVQNGKRDSKTKALGLLLILCSMLVAFGPLKLLQLPKTDVDKQTFIEKSITFSPAQMKWAELTQPKKSDKEPVVPLVDATALKKLGKVAIISFDANLYAKRSIGLGITALANVSREKEGIKPEDMKKFSDLIYNDFRDALIAREIKVLEPQEVAANAAYDMLELEKKEGVVSSPFAPSMGWTSSASAGGLKSINALAFIKPPLVSFKPHHIEKAARLQKLAKALGADAILIIDNHMYMDESALSGKYELYYSDSSKGPNGITIDMFSAEEPKLLWGAALAAGIKVPTEVGQESRAASLLGFTKYEFGKSISDFENAYKILAGLFADRLKRDMQIAPLGKTDDSKGDAKSTQ